MPKNTPTAPITSTPPGMDIARIEAALRTLAETAVAEEAQAATQNGGTLPDYTDNPSARAVSLTISTACRTAYHKLAGHLVALIGHRAASVICGQIGRDVQDESAAIAAQPSTARH